MIVCRCPACAALSRVGDELLAKPVRCPKCRAVFLAHPAPLPPPPPPAPVIPPPARPPADIPDFDLGPSSPAAPVPAADRTADFDMLPPPPGALFAIVEDDDDDEVMPSSEDTASKSITGEMKGKKI